MKKLGKSQQELVHQIKRDHGVTVYNFKASFYRSKFGYKKELVHGLVKHGLIKEGHYPRYSVMSIFPRFWDHTGISKKEFACELVRTHIRSLVAYDQRVKSSTRFYAKKMMPHEREFWQGLYPDREISIEFVYRVKRNIEHANRVLREAEIQEAEIALTHLENTPEDKIKL